MLADDIYNLSDEELAFARTKKGAKNQLGFGVLFKYFQFESRYPKHIKYVDPMMLNCIANQLKIAPSRIEDFDWEGRSTERFRQEIRNFLGYKKASLEDVDKLKKWLIDEVFPNAEKWPQQIEQAYTYFCNLKMEPFTSKEMERHIRSARQKFDKKLFESIYTKLSKTTIEMMDSLLIDGPEDDETNEDEESETEYQDTTEIKFRHLRQDIPGAKLKHVAYAIKKVVCLNQLNLPVDFLSTPSPKLIKKYYRRVMATLPSGMLEHKEPIRYATFSMFCYFRSQSLTDSLADLLLQLTHKLRTSSEGFVDKKILSEVKRVNGKFDILYKLAITSLSNPEGIIQDTIYPAVDEETLGRLVKEMNCKGKWYVNQVQIKMHSLYSHAHRNLLLTLLGAFMFKTRLNESKPLLEAIKIILSYRDISGVYYPPEISVPLEIIPSGWRDLVIGSNNSQGPKKIIRFNYELAVLEELEKQLGCKMVWIEGAFRYRDPDSDLPKDFEENREHYFNDLGLPLNPKEFTDSKKAELDKNLKLLNDSILENKKVKILPKNGGHIKISPYAPQAEPPNIKELHQAIKKEWQTINLIDILKEAELQIGFTDLFQTVASRTHLSAEDLRLRLLLCFYAIGTNVGLKPISAANNQANHSHLRYVKRRYITIEGVRQALIKIINATLAIRDPRIWGESTTGVACDSKKLSVWDQNLMVEWHARYKGRGVMVYWHVDAKALCIYSQLKTCSSSEVGSMLKGILQHCTAMDVDKAYVDTHGQSMLGFGVSELLKFDLLPRLKNIHAQKLYYPSPNHKNKYENLEEILKGPINWTLIEDHYDEAIKHIVALKTGTMESDVFVKRFSKDNYQHPVYQAIIEIGKVAKTNFLCRYLMSEELRIEIHESQNVVERLNSIMNFIFYGKLGEISSNAKEEQELSILCLHLLQACMSYINTIIFQVVLSKPEWENRLTQEDKRALNLLFHSHINPYGLFPLDLDKRLGISMADIRIADRVSSVESIEEEVEQLA